MKRRFIAAIVACCILMLPTLAHDLFLKPESFFSKINEKMVIKILNGTFQESEGTVSFERFADASVVPPSGSRLKAVESDFTNDANTSFWNLQPRDPGSYVVGLSTMTREIDLKAKDFNAYLVEDGIPATLAERKAANELEKDARERYSKHVKTIFQVGDRLTDNYKTILGYPVEIVPKNNPYRLKTGDTAKLLCLKDGKPLIGQVVMSGREDASGKLALQQNVRTDKKGIAKIKIDGPGKWFAKFINMKRLTDPKLNYESKWASLTFAIR